MFILIARSNLVNVHKFLRIFSALLCTVPQFAPWFSLYSFCLDVAVCAWADEMWKLIVYMKQRVLVC